MRLISEIYKRFPKYLAKKLRHGFVDERALITTLTSSCHWKTLKKKRPENVFLPLIVNYRKIVHKNKLYDSKQ